MNEDMNKKYVGTGQYNIEDVKDKTIADLKVKLELEHENFLSVHRQNMEILNRNQDLKPENTSMSIALSRQEEELYYRRKDLALAKSEAAGLRALIFAIKSHAKIRLCTCHATDYGASHTEKCIAVLVDKSLQSSSGSEFLSAVRTILHWARHTDGCDKWKCNCGYLDAIAALEAQGI